MNFKKIVIYINTSNVYTLISYMLNIGVPSFSLEGDDDFIESINDKNVIEATVNDKRANITVHLKDDEQGKKQFEDLKSVILDIKNISENPCDIEIKVDEVTKECFYNNSGFYFKPLEIGDKFIIKGPFSKCNEFGNRIVVEIDNELCYNKFYHKSMSLCTKSLENTIKKNDDIINLDCKNGILSIVCLKLGANTVIGVDVNENNIKTSIKNIEKNNIPKDKFIGIMKDKFHQSMLNDEFVKKEYDVIVINDDDVLGYNDFFLKYLKNNGKLIVSGIIEKKIDELDNLLVKTGLTLFDKECMDGLYTLIFFKQGEE